MVAAGVLGYFRVTGISTLGIVTGVIMVMDLILQGSTSRQKCQYKYVSGNVNWSGHSTLLRSSQT